MGQVPEGLINPVSTLEIFSNIRDLKQCHDHILISGRARWHHSVSELGKAKTVGRICGKESILIMMV